MEKSKWIYGFLAVICLLLITLIFLVVRMISLQNSESEHSQACNIDERLLIGIGCTQDSDCYGTNERCEKNTFTCAPSSSAGGYGSLKTPISEEECERLGGTWS